MSEPFVGEIRIFGGNYAPMGWAFCNGQLLSISENQAPFSLIGTTYGGDGQTTFAMPNLMGRVPMGMGQGPGLSPRTIGEAGGTETVTLGVAQVASHTHMAVGQSASGDQLGPANQVWAASSINRFSTSPPDVAMASGAISQAGGGQPHDNMMPFTVFSYIIALQGIYPSRP